MNMEAILNDIDTKRLDDVAGGRSQSIIIEGESGLNHIGAATYLASRLGGSFYEVQPIDRATGKIDIENGKILVPQIRELHDSTRSKSTKPQATIIHHAERMTVQAQNAFLKLLEEPKQNVYFILLSTASNNLLPTVLSRLTRVRLHPISAKQSSDLLDKLGVDGPQKRRQILFIANGLPEQLKKLATDDKYFKDQADLTTTAKLLLQADTYKKLVIVNKYKDNREAATELVDKALLIAKRSIKAQPSAQLAGQIGSLLQIKDDLTSNGNVRLALMNVAL